MKQKKIKKFIDKNEWIFIFAAILTVPIFIIETYLNPPYRLYLLLEIISWAIWFLFAGELAVKWYVDRDSTPLFVRHNAVSMLILILPLIRILRFVEIVKVNRLIQQVETASVIKDLKKIADLRRIFQI